MQPGFNVINIYSVYRKRDHQHFAHSTNSNALLQFSARIIVRVMQNKPPIQLTATSPDHCSYFTLQNYVLLSYRNIKLDRFAFHSQCCLKAITTVHQSLLKLLTVTFLIIYAEWYHGSKYTYS